VFVTIQLIISEPTRALYSVWIYCCKDQTKTFEFHKIVWQQ